MAAWFLPLLLIAAPPAPAAAEALAPVDQCASDPSFVAFRDELRAAIARKDAEHVLAVAAEDIQISFGDIAGRAEFARMWDLDRPQDSRLWDELGEVLRLGCARSEGGTFWSPSLGIQLSEEEDPFSTVVAVRPGAILRATPDAGGRVVAELAWDLLAVQPYDGAEEWLAVAMRDGRSGFVQRRDVRSPLDYRAGFDRRDGRWRMITFIAGD